MDQRSAWMQVNITFPDWDRAEPTAVSHLAPWLSDAEASGLIEAWFFIRKYPCWRVRYLPAGQLPIASDAEDRIGQHLKALAADQLIHDWTTSVYEPETHAFGGTEAMTLAHRLFHHDSRCVLAYLQDDERIGAGHRREISIMLCSILMRAAGQDWYEQGDIWARVASHREPSPDLAPDQAVSFTASVRRLLTVDTERQLCDGGPLAHLASWADGYAAAGCELAALAAAGRLHRGLRDVLAHHVIFAWNRLGIPHAAQSALASTSKAIVFGLDPAPDPAPRSAPWIPPDR